MKMTKYLIWYILILQNSYGWLSMENQNYVMYNHLTTNYFCCSVLGRDFMLARLATSHAFGGAYAPSCAAKKDS